MSTIKKIISGGQTGADRGGLQAAVRLSIDHGGFCPKGRLAEDGMVPLKFDLKETSSSKYPPRTIANILAADATLVFSHGLFDRGTSLTLKLVESNKKPFVKMSLKVGIDAEQVRSLHDWLKELAQKLGRPLTVNVAGPRESRCPGLQEHVEEFLAHVIFMLQESELS